MRNGQLGDANEKRRRLRHSEKIVFDLLDVDGDGIINLHDMFQLCSHFHDESSSIGKLVNSLLNYYVDVNLAKAGYKTTNFEFTYDNFKQHCQREFGGIHDLARDLVQVFVTRFQKPSGDPLEEVTTSGDMPSIPDESKMGEEYFQKTRKSLQRFGCE
jgi:hypothetical protein